MSRQQKTWGLLIAALLLPVLAFNFLNFRGAQSATEVQHTLGTYRAGETLPESMAPGFTLTYAVRGEERLAAAVASALDEALEALPSVGSAMDAAGLASQRRAPLLLVELAPDRLWTPFYARATVTAQLYFAYDGDAPWPLDEPVVFEVSPAIKASGEFTLTDRSWGLISKPAYSEHLATALAQRIAAALQDDVFKSPS